MMMFWAIVLLIISLYKTVKGNFANRLHLEMRQINNKEAEEIIGNEEDLSIFIKGVGFLIFCILYLITFIIFLINALKVDVYFYPTLIMLIWFILSFPIAWIMSEKNKKNKQNYLNKLKKRTVIGTVESVAYILYFGYILFLLIF